MSTCPECEANVTVPGDALEGEIIRCADCGAELEVVSVDPVVLGVAPAVEEDWGE